MIDGVDEIAEALKAALVVGERALNGIRAVVAGAEGRRVELLRMFGSRLLCWQGV
jgi:hypothetical protein